MELGSGRDGGFRATRFWRAGFPLRSTRADVVRSTVVAWYSLRCESGFDGSQWLPRGYALEVVTLTRGSSKGRSRWCDRLGPRKVEHVLSSGASMPSDRSRAVSIPGVSAR